MLNEWIFTVLVCTVLYTVLLRCSAPNISKCNKFDFIQATVHPEMKLLLAFTHHPFVPKLYDLLSLVQKHKRTFLNLLRPSKKHIEREKWLCLVRQNNRYFTFWWAVAFNVIVLPQFCLVISNLYDWKEKARRSEKKIFGQKKGNRTVTVPIGIVSIQ